MSKPYSIEKLVEKLKKNGLEVAEDGAQAVYKSFKEWTIESAAESEPKWDDSVAIAFPLLDKVVDPALDKINPEDNA